VVKWYNADKGFGFVQLADGSGDAFLHVSVVERSGHDSISPGTTLEVYGWFTEGFATPDLKEAKALLDEFGA
jgi:CspA family cold shock protein